MIFYQKPSVVEPRSKGCIGGEEPSSAQHHPSVQVIRDRTFVVLLQGQRRERLEPETDASDRRTVPRHTVVRLSSDGPLASASGPLCRPQAGATVDAHDGADADLPGPAHVEASSGTSSVSISTEERDDRPAEPSLVCRCHLYPDATRLFVPRGDHGLVHTRRAGLAVVQHHAPGLLRRGSAGGTVKLRNAGDLQHRSGESVHQRRLHRRVEGSWRANFDGRAWPLDGQHLHRAPVAVSEI